MAEIRTICSEYDPDDIYNCDETEMYLLEVPAHSYSIPEFSGSAKEMGGHTFALRRLPANSTSVTLPLDAGVTSVFKRRYVEMITYQAIVNRYASGKKVTNGEAWSLIPYAWSQVKTSTIRHCFSHHEGSSKGDSRQPGGEIGRYAGAATRVSTRDGHMFKNQKDAQDLPEEIRKAVCERLAERAALLAPREWSPSIEPDDLNSFEALDGVTTKVKDLLASNDPKRE
ncbi:hypothetical protein EC957_010017 [Mortierella hygrophila]|uniref:DDE-1 domain-containing protein n=1 Tax=Mortierella hygrophila TaxID=979708 RepID=A0A9P6K8C8_9FUNG|nr:hypothetical protein EC957_010017 [Mortierella hygrophila]